VYHLPQHGRKYVLGVQTLQMNHDHNYGGTTANQLATLDHLNLFTKPLPAPPEKLSRLVDYRDAGADLTLRARSYLHANCSHCHRKWGGGNAEFQLLATLDVSDTGTLGVRPAHGAFGIPHARILAPAIPIAPSCFTACLSWPGRMPRIGSTVTDERGLRLIQDWIQQLPSAESTDSTDAITRAETDATLQQLAGEAASSDQRSAALERLLSSTSAAVQLAQVVAAKSLPTPLRDEVIAKATRSPIAEVRDLFERFLPEDKRTRRLGAVIDPAEILALGGNVEAGRKIFFEAEGVRCRTCHQIRGVGTALGPT